jgi:hypothetical protein
MSDLLDPRTLDRLAKLCGMFGSAHAGERANAARMADELVRVSGVTWFDVIRVNKAAVADDELVPYDHAERLTRFAVKHAHVLTPWEANFAHSLHEQCWRRFSPKQRAVLDNIVEKIIAKTGARP